MLTYVLATVANTNLRSKYLPVGICYGSKYPLIIANTHINPTLSLSILSYKNYVLLNGLTRSLSKASQKAT